MRLVTDRATPSARFQWMNGDALRQLLRNHGMAREARPSLISANETFAVRGVRIVARRAAFLERLVRPRFLGGPLHWRVATVTELRCRLCLQRLRLRARGVMATRAAGEHLVRLRADQLRPFRTMRVVTREALQRTSGKVFVSPGQRWIRGVMAGAAKRCRLARQEIGAIRSVSGVACVA